ncbi:MAG: 50S ribosomal protein L1 [Candidatus Peregrinibacteria bacterium]|nr:50S ribosomal protein L1 [Candidatus Peregrinibacteria bacterium]MDZ4244916.1 50S ribosomal protein L1 [Candidatus Gracilibacteria bacterium]
MAHGKKYKKSLELLNVEKMYTLAEAVDLAKKTSTTKFDSSVEVHMNLGIDPAQADQQLRKTVSLPHGTGKTLRVIAFCGDERVKEAKAAGAIEAGNEDLVKKIEGGWMEFDKVVATPDVMKSLGKIAKTLGQKGLMPNPKSGTVTTDIEGVVKDLQGGMVEFRNDKQGNLHNIVGKVSFSEAQLLENVGTYLKAINDARPTGIKGTFVKSITLTTSMGPGIKVEVNETLRGL